MTGTQEKQNVPKLRFPGFSGVWKYSALAKIAIKKISYGIVQAGPHVPDGMPYIKSKDLNEALEIDRLERTSAEIAKKYRRSEVKPGDIVFSLRGNIGVSQIVPSSIPVANLTQGTARISVGPAFSNTFIQWGLRSPRIIKRVLAVSKGSTFQEISLFDLRKISIFHPTLPEQKKIASFLGAVDERIGQLERKKELLEAYKKGCMQKLFTRKFRFKRDDGSDFPDWEEKRLGEVFERIRTRNTIGDTNVLSISAQMGLVNQMDYFNHSVASKDLSNYFLLEKGDFAYNKSYSKGYPMGAIKRLKAYNRGVVSPLYICFRAKASETQTFFERLFESGHQNRWIHKFAQEGARNHGLLNLAIGDFFDIPLPFPHPDEQRKIAEFLSAIDEKIALVGQELDHARAFKKGLLQQMFV